MESALCQRACEQNIQLIETLAWDGQSFPRLAAHLTRMAVSAARLGFTFDPDTTVRQILMAVTKAPARLRITLDYAGRITTQISDLPESKSIWHISLAAQRLRSDDPWLTVKSTHRPAYDAARAQMGAGLDEVILLNERDEVCDGSITTLFFDRGQGLRTPPLGCGVLPGVLRAEMGCPEEVLTSKDLPNMSLWVGNSVRGLMRAKWVAPATSFPVA